MTNVLTMLMDDDNDNGYDDYDDLGDDGGG